MKKSYYFIIFSFLPCLFANMLFAQNGWTIYDHTNTPLPDVYSFGSIDIDQSGNIWVGGSYTGLYKFDGTTWTGFKMTNSNILHNDIEDILVDNSGKVWVANYKGISVFNGTNFTNYDTTNAEFNGSTVYALGKDNQGVIWLSSENSSSGNQGITTFDGSTWTNLTNYPSQVNGEEFTKFAFTSSNEAWIASGTGILKYNGAFVFYPYATTGLWTSQTIAIDESGTIWAGGFDGLLKYNGNTWTVYSSVEDFGFTSNTMYNDIFPDGNILWIACSSGLLKFDISTSTILANYNSSNSPLGNNCVSKIKKDADGNLWLATNVGIVKMDPTQIISVDEVDNNHSNEIYPNPFSKQTTIQTDKYLNNATIKVYNSVGQLIKQMDNQVGKTIIFQRENLPNGLYFIYIIEDNKIFSVDKLVISDNL